MHVIWQKVYGKQKQNYLMRKRFPFPGRRNVWTMNGLPLYVWGCYV
jgi:hypothetical protein